ncbi:serpin family protein [Lamellibrachia satsuma]|nr:serpin family protein [Lamellibrachia satsuma]
MSVQSCISQSARVRCLLAHLFRRSHVVTDLPAARSVCWQCIAVTTSVYPTQSRPVRHITARRVIWKNTFTTDPTMQSQWLFLGLVVLGVIDLTVSYDVWTLAAANSKFALRLYDKIVKDSTGDNVFFSPFSISTALAMTYSGARGQTAREMCQTLEFCQLQFDIHAVFRNTLASLNRAHSQYTLTLANAVFVKRGYHTFPSFRNLLTNSYSAGFRELDFHGDPSGSAQYINDWVEQRTNNKIKDIVSAEDVKLAALALVNAIYFKGSWKYPFDEGYTKKSPFHVSPTLAPSVKMMIQTAEFKHSQNKQLDCQILEMPYEGDRLAMYILLPTAVDGLAALESKLTIASVTSALAGVTSQTMSVAIPRFKMTVEATLPAVLKAMGMKRAFKQIANFSGMSQNRPLWVSDVIHKAFIGVDEIGTEATAATVVVMTWRSKPLPLRQDFAADHPFVFLIRDNVTGSILFLGRVMNPSA